MVSDRYFYSCLANLRARGYEQDRWIYEISASIPKPDLAFFLDVDVDTAIRRVRSRASERDRYIDVPLQHRLRREYWEIAAENGGSRSPLIAGKRRALTGSKRRWPGCCGMFEGLYGLSCVENQVLAFLRQQEVDVAPLYYNSAVPLKELFFLHGHPGDEPSPLRPGGADPG